MSDKWPRRTLSTIASRIESGGTPSRDVPTYWGDPIPWATPGELTKHRGKYLEGTHEKITTAGLSSSGARLLPANSLMVTTRATLGTVALAGIPMATNQGFKSLVFNDGVDPSFYYHLFGTLSTELSRRASGTTFLEISSKEFANIVVPVPPLQQQRKIAEILDTVDDSIHLTEGSIEKLELIRTGTIDRLFSRSSSWKSTSLHEIVKPSSPICYGIVQVGPHIEGGIPVVMIGNVRRREFGQQLHRTSRSIDIAYRRSRVLPGDLVLSIKATIGMVAVIPSTYQGNISRDLARIRLIPGIEPEYMRIFFESNAGRRALELAVVGTTRAEVSIGILKKITVPVAPISDQTRIIRIICKQEELLDGERATLAKLHQIKRGLLEDLLTGRVRVKT